MRYRTGPVFGIGIKTCGANGRERLSVRTSSNPRPDRVEPQVVFVGGASFPQGLRDTKAVASTGIVTVVTA